MPVAESLFKQTELSPKDIDLYVASEGPGSFTGIRIGIAAVLGFANATGVACVGVSTLDALALPYANSNSYVCPLIDAKRNRAYFALYLNGERIREPECTDINEILEICKTLDKNIVFTGDFVHGNDDVIKDSLKDKAVISEKTYCDANALSVALLGEKVYKSGKYNKISPDYVLKSYVEELGK